MIRSCGCGCARYLLATDIYLCETGHVPIDISKDTGAQLRGRVAIIIKGMHDLCSSSNAFLLLIKVNIKPIRSASYILELLLCLVEPVSCRGAGRSGANDGNLTTAWVVG